MNCENIKIMRKQKGFTQQQLADLLYVENAQTVSAWEKNTNRPSYEMIEKMSDLFGCDPAYLTGSQEEPRKEYREYGKYTGLSDNAIQALHYLASHKKSALSKTVTDLLEEVGGVLAGNSDKRVTDTILGKMTDIRQMIKIHNAHLVLISDEFTDKIAAEEFRLSRMVCNFCEGEECAEK